MRTLMTRMAVVCAVGSYSLGSETMAQGGPTVLVGHSYGGVVITEAGNDPKVVSLVYVAAFAPDAGQSIGEISQAFAKPAGADQVQPQSNGFLLLSQKGIEEDFAQDLTPAEKAHLVAAQPKTSGAIFEAKPTAAAWRAKPAWYVVSSNDRMIDPEQEKSMAKQVKAKATVLPSSHVAMLSHPAKSRRSSKKPPPTGGVHNGPGEK